MKEESKSFKNEVINKQWSIQDYSKYLYSVNNHQCNNETEFIIKSSALLTKYVDNKFWLYEPKDAFLFLLNEIKNNNFDINNIVLVLPDSVILEGFEEYILDYVNSRDYISMQEKKKLKKLAKEKELDLLIQTLIKQEFFSENNLKEKNNCYEK